MVFVVTACAYGMMAYRAIAPAAASTATAPTHRVSRPSYGVEVLGWELGLLAVPRLRPWGSTAFAPGGNRLDRQGRRAVTKGGHPAKTTLLRPPLTGVELSGRGGESHAAAMNASSNSETVMKVKSLRGSLTRRRSRWKARRAARCAGWWTKQQGRRTSPCGSSRWPPAATRPSTAIPTSTRCSCSKAAGVVLEGDTRASAGGRRLRVRHARRSAPVSQHGQHAA